VTADLRGAAIITAFFLVLLVAAELWSRHGHPKPEWTRKLVHLGGGMIGLLLPWLIESPLVVFILTASLSTLFVLGERWKFLESLHGVERKSRGSEYYPLAIWLVFVLAADRRWLYLSAVLVLAVADASAALIGSRYGKHRYEVEDEFKSVEGSLVFFVVAFLATSLPMLLMTSLPRAVCLLSALLVAMLVTIFEAISLRGTDNLFVPVAVVFVLQKITTKPVEHIALQNVALVGIVALVMLIAWRVEWFNPGGALSVTLFLYAAWSLGPRFTFVIPAFIGLAALAVARVILNARGERRRFKVRAVTRTLIVPFLFLLAANSTGKFDFFYGPYVATCAAVLAFNLADERPLRALAAGAFSAALIALPALRDFRALEVILVVAFMSMLNARFADPREWGAPSFLFALLAGMAMLIL
jgi:phytol kinase